jgi:hypothetical protein
LLCSLTSPVEGEATPAEREQSGTRHKWEGSSRMAITVDDDNFDRAETNRMFAGLQRDAGA